MIEAQDRYFGKLLALCIPPFMVGLDMLIMSVALVPMSKTFHAHIATLQWFMSGYGIGVSSFLITAGKLADIYTHRRALIIGIILFSLCSLLVAVTPIAELVIVWRVFQGIGGAFILVSTISLASKEFPHEKRTVVFGIMVAAAGLGTGIGPIIGGLIIHYTSWQIVFWINVPIGILSICSILRVFKSNEAGISDHRIDYLGLVLMTSAMVLITIGIAQGNVWGWTSVATLCCICIAVVLFIVFLWFETKSDHPLLQLHLFSIKNFSMANIAGFTSYFFMLGWLFVFSLYLPRTLHLTPLYTGISELPFSIVFFLTGLYSGKLINRIGAKSVIILGLITLLVASIMLAFTQSNTQYYYFAIAFACVGMGFVYVNGASLPAVMQFLPKEEIGSGSGTSMLFRWFGAAMGVALMSAVYGGSAISFLSSQVNNHSEWLKILNLKEFITLLMHHTTDKNLRQYFPDTTQFLAVKDAYDNAYAYAVDVCMWVLTGLSAVTLVLAFLFLKTPAKSNTGQPAPIKNSN